MNTASTPEPGALQGMRVIDVSTLFAGPLAALFLGDHGADVIKVEHPEKGDPARKHGYSKDGVNLWWKILGRNKRNITLNLSHPEGRDLFLQLAETADVVIENFRPGTLERWGLGYDELAEVNPGIILARVTGFGQFGPLAKQAGFGTLAEAMSGFAHITGEEDGPPTLPPFALADGIAALAGAFAVMTAIHSRERTGVGQVIDLSLIEPIMTLLGPQPTVYDQLGIIPRRTGNRSINNSPRNTYQSKDGRWLAVSTSAQSVAERVMHLIGRPDLVEQPWFASGYTRAQHADELDAAVGGWIAERDAEEVLSAFAEAQAAVAPIYSVADVMEDPQYQALESIISMDDPELGRVKMQNVMFRMSGTPGDIKWTGGAMGSHNEAVFDEIGVDASELNRLKSEGVI